MKYSKIGIHVILNVLQF